MDAAYNLSLYLVIDKSLKFLSQNFNKIQKFRPQDVDFVVCKNAFRTYLALYNSNKII